MRHSALAALDMRPQSAHRPPGVSFVLPGLLAGLYGYAVGTPLGLLVTSLLKR